MLRPPRLSPAALGPLALGALLIVLAGLVIGGRRPPPRFAPAGALNGPPIVLAQAPAAPGIATQTPAPLGGQYTQAEGFELVIADDLFTPDEQAALAAELDQALRYVSQRFGSAPGAPLSIYVGSEPGCSLHGIAYTDIRSVQVFTCRELPMGRTVNILAHEFVHQLCQDRYGAPHLSADLVLSEGVATWGAGSYWLGEAATFRAFVRPWLASGNQLPLGQSYVGLPISAMNQLYYQWASFVEYLIEQYGRERFDSLYLTGQGAPGSADYRAVYGKSFLELETEWQAWVLR